MKRVQQLSLIIADILVLRPLHSMSMLLRYITIVLLCSLADLFKLTLHFVLCVTTYKQVGNEESATAKSDHC